jgi:hypothetical protein
MKISLRIYEAGICNHLLKLLCLNREGDERDNVKLLIETCHILGQQCILEWVMSLPVQISAHASASTSITPFVALACCSNLIFVVFERERHRLLKQAREIADQTPLAVRRRLQRILPWASAPK